MQQPAIWRELLRSSIENSQEGQQIASELGVNPMTLMRWVNGKSVPRLENLRRLLSALPQHRDHLIKLIGQKFKSFAAVMRDEHSQFPGYRGPWEESAAVSIISMGKFAGSL